MIPPFPFIVGCGRSGSTLLRAMLDSHPDLSVPGETYFLEQLLRRRDRFAPDGRFDLDEFERELTADPRFRSWGVDPSAVHDSLREHVPDDLAGAIRAVYAAARAPGSTRCADKTPSYALCVDAIADALPESVFIHLVRDPRDVAASYRSASWGPRSLVAAAGAWRLRVGAAMDAGRRVGADRYLEVHYEDLVASPEPVLTEICRFIALEFDPRMLRYEDGRTARTTAHRDNGAHLGLLRPPTPGVRDWRTDLTPAEAARVGRLTDPLATRLGYEPSPACRGVNLARYGAERSEQLIEAASLRFRRTRAANRLRGPWRSLRGRGVELPAATATP